MTIWLLSMEPDEDGRFDCFLDGYREQLTLDKIRDLIDRKRYDLRVRETLDGALTH